MLRGPLHNAVQMVAAKNAASRTHVQPELP